MSMAHTTDKGILNFFRKKKKSAESENDSEEIKEFDTPSSSTKISKLSMATEETHYNTDNVRIGYALIFNHVRIEGQKERLGTDKDKDRIKKALRSYGFEVKICNDYTFKKINETMKKYSQMDHSHNDCFVVVVMSHGLSGKIFAADMAYPIERLWNPFLGRNCKSLINKPKLFFIQACRGEKLDHGVQYNSSRSKLRSLSGARDDEPEPVTYTIPTTADLLVFYSTFEEHYSWRSPLNGSWFIQSLSEVLEESAKTKKPNELYLILTAVNRKVAYEYQSHVPTNENFDEMKAMSNFVSTLTKTFFMIPKN